MPLAKANYTNNISKILFLNISKMKIFLIVSFFPDNQEWDMVKW